MPRLRFIALLLPLWLTVCESNPDNVCENIGLCEGQDDPTIATCKVQASELGNEAFDAGCGTAYNDYFSCANGAYTCTGDTVTFPGCQGDLDTLNTCLAAGQASTSCGALTRALAACPGADAGTSGPIPSPCTASGTCASSCYLQAVPDVCAPLPAQLVAYQSCAAVCI